MKLFNVHTILYLGLVIQLFFITPGQLLAQPLPEKAKPVSQSTSEITVEVVQGYLTRMGGLCRQANDNELHTEAKAGDTAYSVLVKVDPQRFYVYLSLTDILKMDDDQKRITAVCRRLARLNFELLLGKLEWDQQGQTVRMSYTFSTEEGLGEKTFRAVMATLLQQAGPVRKQLAAAAAQPD